MNAFHPSMIDYYHNDHDCMYMGCKLSLTGEFSMEITSPSLHKYDYSNPTHSHRSFFFDLGQCVCIKGHIIDFHTHSEPTVCLTDRDRVLLFQPCASALVYISFLCRKEKCTSNPYRPAYTYCKMLYALAQLCQADE